MKKLWGEFKKFISRGNVLDMAVGVIIGGAFNAIVTSLVSILMSVATWRIPGGIKGLVSVLPAANDIQKGLDDAIGLGQKFEVANLQTLAKALAEKTYGSEVVATNPNLIESVKSTILSKYTIHGKLYTYNMSAVIDWGSFINAIISFLIIALTLFVIIKVVASLQKARANLTNTVKIASEKEAKGLPLTKKEKKALEEAKANEEAAAAKAAADEEAAKAAADAEASRVAREEAVKQATIDQAKLLAEIKDLLAKK